MGHPQPGQHHGKLAFCVADCNTARDHPLLAVTGMSAREVQRIHTAVGPAVKHAPVLMKVPFRLRHAPSLQITRCCAKDVLLDANQPPFYTLGPGLRPANAHQDVDVMLDGIDEAVCERDMWHQQLMLGNELDE
ncbi:hypothetical protein D3C81_952350 [compost metagenome]